MPYRAICALAYLALQLIVLSSKRVLPRAPASTRVAQIMMRHDTRREGCRISSQLPWLQQPCGQCLLRPHHAEWALCRSPCDFDDRRRPPDPLLFKPLSVPRAAIAALASKPGMCKE